MEVLYDEDIAGHIDPEPCVVSREGHGEASAGERAGWPLSRVRPLSRVPTALPCRKATRTVALSRAASRPGAVRDPSMYRMLLAREPGDLPPGQRRKRLVRARKVRNRSWRCTGGRSRLRHSSDEACEQGWVTSCGAGGAKGGGRGECGTAKHVPGTGPGKRVTSTGPHTAGCLPSDTRGGSRMRECRTYGSVRGARSNARPYRDLHY